MIINYKIIKLISFIVFLLLFNDLNSFASTEDSFDIKLPYDENLSSSYDVTITSDLKKLLFIKQETYDKYGDRPRVDKNTIAIINLDKKIQSIFDLKWVDYWDFFDSSYIFNNNYLIYPNGNNDYCGLLDLNTYKITNKDSYNNIYKIEFEKISKFNTESERDEDCVSIIDEYKNKKLLGYFFPKMPIDEIIKITNNKLLVKGDNRVKLFELNYKNEPNLIYDMNLNLNSDDFHSLDIEKKIIIFKGNYKSDLNRYTFFDIEKGEIIKTMKLHGVFSMYRNFLIIQNFQNNTELIDFDSEKEITSFSFPSYSKYDDYSNKTINGHIMKLKFTESGDLLVMGHNHFNKFPDPNNIKGEIFRLKVTKFSNEELNNYLNELKISLELIEKNRKIDEDKIKLDKEKEEIEKKILAKSLISLQDEVNKEIEKKILAKSLNFSFIGNFSEGLALIIVNNKYGFINKSGEVVIPIKFNSVRNFSEGLALIRVNNKWGFINKSGKIIIPTKFDYVYGFSDGLARVMVNNKWDFINKSGKVVIHTKFDYVDNFSEGLACVHVNNKYGFINKSGKVVIPIEFDSVDNFSKGLARVNVNNKYGFINKSGKIVF